MQIKPNLLVTNFIMSLVTVTNNYMYTSNYGQTDGWTDRYEYNGDIRCSKLKFRNLKLISYYMIIFDNCDNMTGLE